MLPEKGIEPSVMKRWMKYYDKGQPKGIATSKSQIIKGHK